jgi:hypothetical protein
VAAPTIVGVHRVFIRRRLELVVGLLRVGAPRYLAESAAEDLVTDGCRLAQRAQPVPPRDVAESSATANPCELELVASQMAS